MNTNTNTNTAKSILKFFCSYESMTKYCNYRYGWKNANEILSTPKYVRPTSGRICKVGNLYWFNTKNGKVSFKQSIADKDYKPLTDADRANWGHKTYKPAHLQAIDPDSLAERQMEEMAAYIHSGASLKNYYSDRDAGYAY